MTECGTRERQATSQGRTEEADTDRNLGHQVTTFLIALGSRFDTTDDIVCRASDSERKAIGFELRMPSRGTGRGPSH